MSLMRLLVCLLIGFSLTACGDDSEQSSQESVSIVTTQSTTAQSIIPGQGQSASSGAGGVSVTLLPQNPTKSNCLRAIVQGRPGRSAIIWKLNGEVVSSGVSSGFCSDKLKRDDLVTVEVGTIDQGAKTSVSIVNSPPRVVDISSTPAEIFAGIDISVVPVAEDVDGDSVDFSYQWLINGDANPLLVDSTLPGNAFTKGDTIKVQILPNDFYDDGPLYESFETYIPNAAPEIISQPPQTITSLDYRYQVVATDLDDTVFKFQIEEAPQGMTINEETGLIQWSLVEAAPGDHTIAIVVTDPDGAEAAQVYSLTLNPSGTN
jgi:hypothetical protein